MCSNMGAGARRAAAPAAAPAAQAAAPAAAPAAAQQATSRLVSDTGVQNMDDATLTALITRAMNTAITPDGRDDTVAQRIADALGITQSVPESVPREALARYRSQSGDNGLLYRTVNDTDDGSKTARQIAHELTTRNGSYGLNYGGGRVWGTGLYFVGSGAANDPGEAAYHSANGYGYGNAYTVEARLRPGARIATAADLAGPAARAWARSHVGALAKAGIRVDASGHTHSAGRMRDRDVDTTVAMLMGYDGYKATKQYDVYHTIFNLGALQIARGNKYDRALNRALT